MDDLDKSMEKNEGIPESEEAESTADTMTQDGIPQETPNPDVGKNLEGGGESNDGFREEARTEDGLGAENTQSEVRDETNSQPVNDVAGEEQQNKKSKKSKLLILAGLAAVIVVVVVLAATGIARQQRLEYIDNLNLIKDNMFEGAQKAESLCNVTKSIWYDAIYEDAYGGDFNDALDLLYGLDETKEEVNAIKANREQTDYLMGLLKDPKPEFEKSYSLLEELYDVYYDFTKLAMEPTGSLQSYNDDFREYDSEYLKRHDKLEAAIPET